MKTKRNRFTVRGFALVPIEVVVKVNAINETTARTAALRLFKKNALEYVVHNSEDYAAVFDWQPHVVESLSDE